MDLLIFIFQMLKEGGAWKSLLHQPTFGRATDTK